VIGAGAVGLATALRHYAPGETSFASPHVASFLKRLLHFKCESTFPLARE
jgi:hypothetical protein